MPTLSIVINTKNCADTLEVCLQSVVGADEIIVVDMESTDETVLIAQQYTDAIYSFVDVGYADPARNFAFSKTSGDWILIVDADEVIPDELWNKVQSVIHEPQADIYRIPRRNSMFGYWMTDTGWWPDFQVRLFRNGSVVWNEGVHSQPVFQGAVADFPSDKKLAIEHYNFSSIAEYLERLDRYTTVAAQSQTTVANPITGLARLQSEQLRRLFAQNGIADGFHGVALSYLQAFYEFVVELKKWEIQGFTQGNEPESCIAQLRDWQKQLNYWIADREVKQSSGLRRIYWQLRRRLRW